MRDKIDALSAMNKLHNNISKMTEYRRRRSSTGCAAQTLGTAPSPVPRDNPLHSGISLAQPSRNATYVHSLPASPRFAP